MMNCHAYIHAIRADRPDFKEISERIHDTIVTRKMKKEESGQSRYEVVH